MNQLLQHLPLSGSYALSTDQECSAVDQPQYSADALHTRTIAQTPAPVAITPINDVRCGPLGSGPHNSSFSNSQNVSDSGTASLSTSPSSNASSLAYSTNATASLYGHANPVHSIANPYPTASQVFPTQFPLGQSFSGMSNVRPRLASIADPSSGILNPIRSPAVPVTPSSNSLARENYQTSTPGLSRHYLSPRSNFNSVGRASYFAETPRTMMSTPSMMQQPHYSSPAGMTDSRPSEGPPFLDHERFHDLYADGQSILPSIDAKVEKGFFRPDEQSWTCYRRNYFSVQCSYSLSPHPSGRPLYLVKQGEKGQHQVQAMAVSLSAAVDGAAGKVIELVQHTPKRDRGPQTAVAIVKLSPTPPGGKMPHLHHGMAQGYPGDSFGQTTSHLAPYLPLQAHNDNPGQAAQVEADPSGYVPNVTSPTAHQHTFERIQFKSATANNGKRRAQQQYYHLIIELYADIRKTMDKDPKWVKVAQRVSTAVVVRGRSPSHYQNEGPNSARSTGAPGGSAAGLGLGSMMRSANDGMFGNNFSYGGGMSHHHYRGGNSYALESSPVGSYTTSSASGDTTADGRPMLLAATTGDDMKPLVTHDGYHPQYYATSIYDTGLPDPSKLEGHVPSYDAKPRVDVAPVFPPGGIASAWQAGGCGRLQSISSTRGYYPTVDSGY